MRQCWASTMVRLPSAFGCVLPQLPASYAEVPKLVDLWRLAQQHVQPQQLARPVHRVARTALMLASALTRDLGLSALTAEQPALVAATSTAGVGCAEEQHYPLARSLVARADVAWNEHLLA